MSNTFELLPNNLFQATKELSQKKIRTNNKLFVAEGKKCCYELFMSDYETEFVVINNSIYDINIMNLANLFYAKNISVYQVKSSLFESLSNAANPQGILAVAKMRKEEIVSNTSFIALDNIADPGNVGTIIRTADWFGIRQIILIGTCVDKFNAKLIRASMGSFFHTKIFHCENDANFFKKYFDDINIVAATLEAQQELLEVEKTNEFGLIVGNEARGISPFLDEIINEYFFIAGFGNTESLNVGVAAGISLFYMTS